MRPGPAGCCVSHRASPSGSVRRLVKHGFKDADTDQRVYLTSVLPWEEHGTEDVGSVLGSCWWGRSISHKAE